MEQNNFYDRTILTDLKKYINRKEIYAIKGPRQAGKTTILKIIKKWLIEEKKVKEENIIFLTFEDFEILDKFNLNPKQYINSFILNNDRYYFLLDEFQYASDGGKKLKLLYDTIENAKFIITGSSSLELTASTAKYLVGRVFYFDLMPFSFEEFLNAKDKRLANIYRQNSKIFDDFIHCKKINKKPQDLFCSEFELLFGEFATFGGYPEVIKANVPEEKKQIIKNLNQTYVEKDVTDLLKIHDVFKFRKLTSVLSAQLGGIANYNELSLICSSHYKEIMNFLDCLEGTYIIKRIRPFYSNKKTELKKNPKIYFIDIGLRNYTAKNFNDLDIRTEKGQIIENVVLSQLLCRFKDSNICYWRTTGGAEVDFVIEIENKLIPVEVKYAGFKTPKITRSFRSFLDLYKPKRAVVITHDFYCVEKINDTEILFIPVCYI
ncbi:MAG: ATP-binding protein [Candidatus Aenigmarchaeota archaeon]|nr:ATP-binding protein [Candidatus Aenigmarchaeota archaeon]